MSVCKSEAETRQYKKKGLLLAATSLINFLGLTRFRVQSIAPTGPHECPHFPLFPTLLSEPDFNIGRLMGRKTFLAFLFH